MGIGSKTNGSYKTKNFIAAGNSPIGAPERVEIRFQDSRALRPWRSEIKIQDTGTGRRLPALAPFRNLSRLPAPLHARNRVGKVTTCDHLAQDAGELTPRPGQEAFFRTLLLPRQLPRMFSVAHGC